MDLPDCPPGAEGYQDSVTEIPKKPEDMSACTKAEQEFQDHLNSLKIQIDDGSYKCMVERRGRDVSGKWIYLCYPCAAVCSGEAILQTHISGKKHMVKLSMKNTWPMSIFSDHPFNQSEIANKIAATPKVVKKMEEEVALFNNLHRDDKYSRTKDVRCHIQDTLDEVTAPLIGVEYLVEHPPLEPHYEPSYTCTLCFKQGHPRTIVNHMTCFWHRHNYLQRHFPKAAELMQPFRQQLKYRDGLAFIMNRIAQRIVEKYGRMKPINVDKEEYEKEKERVHQSIFKGPHYTETPDCTFEEVVDIDLINTLHKSSTQKSEVKDPSPPVVAVPKPNNINRPAARRERHVSMESLSDLSDDLDGYVPSPKGNRVKGDRTPTRSQKARYEPYPDKSRDVTVPRPKYAALNSIKKVQPRASEPGKRQPNYEYKVHLAVSRRKVVEDAAAKSLVYHEKNPEKHPLYPEEWKKFWNRRYKEIQAEGKDPSKHDFKPEWIVYWTGRMKELHREELRLQVVEIYRKMCLSPPPLDSTSRSPPPAPRDAHPSSHDKRRKSTDGKDARRRTPDHKERKRSPECRRRSPLSYRGAPDMRRRSPEPRRRSPEPRRRTPPYRRDYRSPIPHHRRSPRRHSPLRSMRSRSRSPGRSLRSPPRTHIVLDSRGSRSPLSRRETSHRNRSPVPRNRSPVTRIRSPALRNRSPGLRRTRSPPVKRSSITRNRSPTRRHRSPATRTRSPDLALQTVLISDDELKPEDGASPWNSDNSLVSLGSLPDARSLSSPPRTRTETVLSRPAGGGATAENADNVVATLRTLVALEDYLGSLGPKIVDLLAEAIKMEKDKANSSEELLERETAVVLIETAKEKLKGAAQAGLVASAATAAVRAAVVRAAATLHEADKRMRQKAVRNKKPPAAVPVAGVGAVDRAQIAQQMAAALVAQGKTDVSEEELAHLVDAVVGMAEAKKREAEEKKQASALSASAPVPAAVSETASALQMLQSAYDDKKCEREDAPDAMDGLSDSDLETLLKNFNELSAEEQHSLIAYLKKLEAREPQRVERLRQYVSAAAARAPIRAPPTPAPAPNPAPAPRISDAALAAAAADSHAVPIESDDDDYTVEEVFKSATAKVKEDKIRQEMEIVKKSLEESSVTASESVKASSYAPTSATNTNLPNNLSSAANLLALMQASLQSAKKPVKSAAAPAGVVTSNTQPRSFGDKPDLANPADSIIDPPPGYADRTQDQPPFLAPEPTRRNLTYINTPNTSNESRNPNTSNDPRFGTNNSYTQNDPRYSGNNLNIQRESQFGTNNPRFGGNNVNVQSEPHYGANKPVAPNDSRFGGNNLNVQSEAHFGANNPVPQNDTRFGGSTTYMPGTLNLNVPSEPLYGGNTVNVSNEQNYANNPPVNKDPRLAGNKSRMHNETSYGGGNLSYNGPQWETRQIHNLDTGPPRDQGYNNYPQDSSYNHGERSAPQDMYSQRPQVVGYNNTTGGRMQDSYDPRPQITNQPQYGTQSNYRGRGSTFINRGRGRGRGAW